MSYLDPPDAVHISTRSRSPSRRDVEANSAIYARSNDLITKNHIANDSQIPMSDFSVQEVVQAETSEIGLRRDAGEDDVSAMREPTSVVQSWKDPSINKYRTISGCIFHITDGLNDSAPGALIPYIEKHYHITYSIVSVIFLSNALGFISAAFAAPIINKRLGRGGTMVLAALLMALGYSLIVWEPPFAVVVISFFFTGAGMALELAQVNIFFSGMRNGTGMLGLLHGCYGIGGIFGPLIGTALVSRGINWSKYYYIPLGLSIFNAIFVNVFFPTASEQQAVYPNPSSATTQPDVSREPSVSNSSYNIMRRSLRNKETLLTAAFILCYQGAEVSIAGWVVSFLIVSRKGNPSEVGYVASGFWSGITVGRLALSHVAYKFGERRFVIALILGSLVFEALVWAVPNVISNAVSVSIVGLFLGPIYPCTMTIATQLIDRTLHVPSLSFISAFGSSGGALAPFTTGLLAQAKGPYVLHPVCIALFVLMEATWFSLPKVQKKIS